jgi:hypothetical protein
MPSSFVGSSSSRGNEMDRNVLVPAMIGRHFEQPNDRFRRSHRKKADDGDVSKKRTSFGLDLIGTKRQI